MTARRHRCDGILHVGKICQGQALVDILQCCIDHRGRRSQTGFRNTAEKWGRSRPSRPGYHPGRRPLGYSGHPGGAHLRRRPAKGQNRHELRNAAQLVVGEYPRQTGADIVRKSRVHGPIRPQLRTRSARPLALARGVRPRNGHWTDFVRLRRTAPHPRCDTFPFGALRAKGRVAD